LDWDGIGRSERIDVLDAVTGKVLDSRTVAGFSGGEYLVWTLGGHVLVRLTNLAGNNAVLSGLFFGPGAGSAGWAFVQKTPGTHNNFDGGGPYNPPNFNLNNTTQILSPFPANPKVGNLVFVVSLVFNESTNTTDPSQITATDNAATPNTYTNIFSVVKGNTNIGWSGIAVLAAQVQSLPASGTLTVTTTCPGISTGQAAQECLAMEFSGGSTTIDGSVGTYHIDTGVPLRSGTLTAGGSNDLILALFTDRQLSEPSGLSYPSGFTGVGLETDGYTWILGGVAYKIVSGGYSADTQWAPNTTDGWAAAQLALSPAGGSPH
jgi:hypothetical protein